MARYEVVRYPLYYVVVDHQERDPQGQSRVVFESRRVDTARATAKRLNKESTK